MKTRSILTSHALRAFLIGATLMLTACGSGSSGGGGSNANPQFTTTTQNAFTSFSSVTGSFGVGPQGATASASVPGALFLVGNTGSQVELYKLDISGNQIRNVTGSPFILPNSGGKVPITTINIQDSGTAFQCVSDSSTGANTVVYLYNPGSINSNIDFTPIDLSQGNLLTISPVTGQMSADGMLVTSNYEATFPVGAAGFATGNSTMRLYVGFSNPTSNFGSHFPGTILVYDVDFAATSPIITRVATIFTQTYNPTALVVGQSLAGTRLFLTCEGGADSTGADRNGALEVYNPVTDTRTNTLDLGTTDPFGPIKFSDQGDKGFIVTNPLNGRVRVHEINIDPFRVDITYFVSESSIGSNFSNNVEISAGGDLIYLQLPADRTVYIIRRSDGAVIDTVSTPTSGRSTSAFTETPSYFARRPGDPNSILYSVVLAGPNTSGGALDVVVPTFR